MNSKKLANSILKKHKEIRFNVENSFAKESALLEVKGILKVLYKMRATKQILEQYRIYLEVKIKIENQ